MKIVWSVAGDSWEVLCVLGLGNCCGIGSGRVLLEAHEVLKMV